MPGRFLALALGAIVVLLVLASVITGDGAIVAAAGLFLVIVVGFALFQAFLAKRQGGGSDPSADRADTVPAAHLPDGDDGRPLGDTAEAHDELSPHDLPIGHPGRAAAERQAGGEDGTTTGHQDGGAAPATERLGDRS